MPNELSQKELLKKSDAITPSEATAKPKREKSYPKAAGLKSTFTLPTGELLMTSFGRGSEALFQKRIFKDVVQDVHNKDEKAAFTIAPQERQFDIRDVTIHVNQQVQNKNGEKTIKRIEISDGILSDDPRASKKKPGQDLIGAKDALEQRYFGETFTDNIHIQLIYRILDIKKILAVHTNNIVYTLDNLARNENEEFKDFIGTGYISLQNDYEKYCNPENPNVIWKGEYNTNPKKREPVIQNIRESYSEFKEYLKNPRLSYYGHAFFRTASEDKRYEIGCSRYQAMTEEDRENVRSQYVRSKGCWNKRKAMKELAPKYIQKDDKEIYYIIAAMSTLRQCILHDNNWNRSWLFNLEDQLEPDAAAVLNGIYAEKIRSLNDFTKNSASSNFRLLFDALNAKTDHQKSQMAVDFYKFSVRKVYKNTGFSIKLLRESMIDTFAPEYRTDKRYDSIRGKLYQLWDFFIWNIYDKDKTRAKKLVDCLRTEIKRDKDEKSPTYDSEARQLWQELRSAIRRTADTLLAITKNRNDPGKIDIKTLKLDENETNLISKAIDHAKDEHGRSIKITTDVSYFSKMIYLATLFLDGKEINDLLTTLINSFDEIASFIDVLKKADQSCDFTDEYQFFNDSAVISEELRAINSFARMTTETVSGKPAMFMDAAMLLGFDDTEEEAKSYLENHILNKNKLPKKLIKGKEQPDTGFRNFIISNVIESDRFRYVVRYGNPKKLKAVMQNEALIRFILKDLPQTQLDRYCTNCLGKEFSGTEAKIEALTQALKKLQFKDFQNVDQSANAARNQQKAKAQGMLSLYLNVIYQLIKNMVYINSRYSLAFAKFEHDVQLLGGDSKDYFSLTKKAISEKKLNQHAAAYLEEDIDHSEQNVVKQFRNYVDHLNSVRNMNTYIADLRDVRSYFGIYHYIIQRSIIAWYNGEKINSVLPTYFEKVNKYHTYCKDFVKALTVPFGYNLPRFKNLSIEVLFDKNIPYEKNVLRETEKEI